MLNAMTDVESLFDFYLDQMPLILDKYDSPTLLPPVPRRQRKRRRCSSPECPNLAQRRGLCKTHGGVSICHMSKCTRRIASNGLCFKHGGGKACGVPHCERAVQKNGRCRRHHWVP